MSPAFVVVHRATVCQTYAGFSDNWRLHQLCVSSRITSLFNGSLQKAFMMMTKNETSEKLLHKLFPVFFLFLDSAESKDEAFSAEVAMHEKLEVLMNNHTAFADVFFQDKTSFGRVGLTSFSGFALESLSSFLCVFQPGSLESHRD